MGGDIALGLVDQSADWVGSFSFAWIPDPSKRHTFDVLPRSKQFLDICLPANMGCDRRGFYSDDNGHRAGFPSRLALK